MRGVTFSEFKDGQNVDMFYNAPDCKPGTPMQEAIRTAKEIRQKFNKDIYVWCDYSVQHMYSQLCMQAFKMAGIEFVAAIPVLSNDLTKRENEDWFDIEHDKYVLRDPIADMDYLDHAKYSLNQLEKRGLYEKKKY